MERSLLRPLPLLVALFLLLIFLSGFLPLASTPALAFSDTAGSPYEEAITTLSELGVIAGYADGRFGPQDPVTRQQFAKLVCRALFLTVTETDVSPFTDVDAATGVDPLYPDHYVAVAAKKGITKGTNTAGTLFSPWNNISRAQVVTMVVRGLEGQFPGGLEDPAAGYLSTWGAFDPTHAPNARKAEYNGVLENLPLASLSAFGQMTRGEIAQVLYNGLRAIGGPEPDPLTVTPTVDESRLETKVLGPEGGSLSITGADGTLYTLTLPPEALVADIEVSLSPVTALAGAPFSGGLVGGVAISPEGYRLQEPATLLIDPAGSPSAPGFVLSGFGCQDDGQEFYLTPAGVTGGGVIEVRLLHFSNHGAGLGTQAEFDAQRTNHPPTDPLDSTQQLARELYGELRTVADFQRLAQWISAQVLNDFGGAFALSDYKKFDFLLIQTGVFIRLAQAAGLADQLESEISYLLTLCDISAAQARPRAKAECLAKKDLRLAILFGHWWGLAELLPLNPGSPELYKLSEVLRQDFQSLLMFRVELISEISADRDSATAQDFWLETSHETNPSGELRSIGAGAAVGGAIQFIYTMWSGTYDPFDDVVYPPRPFPGRQTELLVPSLSLDPGAPKSWTPFTVTELLETSSVNRFLLQPTMTLVVPGTPLEFDGFEEWWWSDSFSRVYASQRVPLSDPPAFTLADWSFRFGNWAGQWVDPSMPVATYLSADKTGRNDASCYGWTVTEELTMVELFFTPGE